MSKIMLIKFNLWRHFFIKCIVISSMVLVKHPCHKGRGLGVIGLTNRTVPSKRETRLAKLSNKGRLKATEPTVYCEWYSANSKTLHVVDASIIHNLCVGQ